MNDRLPTFDANVTSPVMRALFVEGMTIDTLREIAEEVVGLACPECGHLTVDHSWTPDADGRNSCLKRESTLVSQSQFTPSDSPICPCSGTWPSDLATYEHDAWVGDCNDRISYLWGLVIDSDPSNPHPLSLHPEQAALNQRRDQVMNQQPASSIAE